MSRIAVLCLFLSCSCCAITQNISFSNGQQPYGKVLDEVLANNVLTHDGTPFHAVLTFKPQKQDVDPKLSGKVEVYWAAPDRYRLILDTPAFGQMLIVQGDRIQESNRGDFYPGWLQNFVTALLNPMPRLDQLREHPNDISGGPAGSGFFVQPCIGRNDRPGGITDQMTWGSICFDVNRPQMRSVIDFTYYMEFSDFQNFHGKQIARSYLTEVDDNDRLIGSLATLEDWKPDDAMLTVTTPTPLQDRIQTAFVSTAKEESMIEAAPKDVHWPTVHEGPVQGYMIVQATTDRTGQVRETSQHNSDNAELESYGRLVALQYKFRPLVVDGAPEQMIMPLVLHFNTTIANPPPDLDDTESRKIINGCRLPREIEDPASAGHQIEIIFSIDDDGHLDTVGSSDRKIPVLSLFRKFQSCHFAVYKQDGQPTPYRAHVAMSAK